MKKEKSGLICYMTAITVHWDWRLRNSLNRVMLQKMNVTYMKAEVAEIYAGIIRFEGLNTLDALKTNNRDSFVGAINELVSGKVGANDIVNDKDASYRVTDLLKWVAEGLEKSNSVNYPGLDYISAMFMKCIMHFAVMVSKSRSRL